MNERKNPAAVAKATSAPPSRKASGMRVSAREASTAPPANDRRRECKPPSEPGRTVPPATTAAARSRAVADQTRITNPLERPWSRIPTAPPRGLRQVGGEDGDEEREGPGSVQQRDA